MFLWFSVFLGLLRLEVICSAPPPADGHVIDLQSDGCNRVAVSYR